MLWQSACLYWRRLSKLIQPHRKSRYGLFALTPKLGSGGFLRISLIAALALSIELPLLSLLIEREQYRLHSEVKTLVGTPAKAVASKVQFDPREKQFEFNADVMKKEGETPGEQQSQKVGESGKDPQFAFTVDKQTGAKKFYDVNSKLSFTVTPHFGKKSGKQRDGHMVFPSDEGKLILTPKTNGLKEDLVLKRAPKHDLTLKYTLDLPDSLEARINPDGSLGIFSADQTLFGDISFGSDADREKVDAARKNAQKNHMVFALPKPVIKQTGKDGQAIDGGQVQFRLEGKTLAIETHGLRDLNYPISIDPSVVVTSTGDFTTGNNEGGIEFGVDEIKRGGLTGGSIGSWTTSTPIIARSDHGTVIHNGYIYVLGGNAPTGYYADSQFAKINSDGTLDNTLTSCPNGGTLTGGTWCSSTSFSGARGEHATAVYNGYIYIMGGYNGVFLGDVQYAKIQPDGSLSSWTTSANTYTTNRVAPAAAAAGGFLYVAGGNDGSARLIDVQYAPIHADGTLGVWAATTSMPVALHAHNMDIYNKTVYVSGGSAAAGVSRQVQYASINPDGTFGAWVITTSLIDARYYHASGVHNGYLYVMAGAGSAGYLTSVEYAPIHANGSLGAWAKTATISVALGRLKGAIYNGHLYATGGYDGTSRRDIVQLAKIDPSGVTSTYTATTSFPTVKVGPTQYGRYGHRSVVHNGYLYITGGYTNAARTDVYSAPLNADGTVGAWTAQTAFPAARFYHTSMIHNGYLYVIGGTDGTNVQNTVYYAQLTATGTIAADSGCASAWCTATGFTTARRLHTSILNGDYLYILGGNDGNTAYYADVQYAKLNANGTIAADSGCAAAWCSTSSFTNGRSGHGSVLAQGYIYVIGGHAGTAGYYADVQYARLTSTGAIAADSGCAAAWCTTTSFNTARNGHLTVTDRGYLYILGGYDGTSSRADVQYARLTSTGAIAADSGCAAAWCTTENLPSARYHGSSAVHAGKVYILGGFNGTTANLADVQYAEINNGGAGTTGPWSASTSLAASRIGHASVVYNGYVYVLGGFTSTSSAEVLFAPINENGSVGTWSATTSFANARHYLTAVANNGYMYILGGEDMNDVQYAPINPDGTVGAWSATTSFTTGRSDHESIVHNNYIYIFGGRYYDVAVQDDAPLSDVQYAPINANGTVGTWATTTSLDVNMYGHSSHVINGYVYILGGSVGNSVPKSGIVRYASINSNGTLGSWSKTSNFSDGRVGHSSVYLNGYIYVFGGTNGTRNDNVQRAAIHANGTLGAWDTLGKLPTVRSEHSSVTHNGYVYVIGGYGATAQTAAVELAALDSIPRTARYSKLIDLGSDQSLNNIGFNGSGGGMVRLSYRTSSTGTPAFSAVTSVSDAKSGTSYPISGTARYLLVTLELNDSTNAFFADAGSTPRSIQDITVNYGSSRPPVDQVLRGGQAVQAGTKSPIDILAD